MRPMLLGCARLRPRSPAIVSFWRLSGDPTLRLWLSRAKSRQHASVYGTEGQRFESSRARYLTRHFMCICRDFASGGYDASLSLGNP